MHGLCIPIEVFLLMLTVDVYKRTLVLLPQNIFVIFVLIYREERLWNYNEIVQPTNIFQFPIRLTPDILTSLLVYSTCMTWMEGSGIQNLQVRFVTATNNCSVTTYFPVVH